MRRALPVALALAALLVSAGLVAHGLRCGMKVVDEPCFSPEECDAEARCEPRVHPFLWIYGAFSLAALAGAWRGWPALPLGVGVVGAGMGALAGLSLGPLGLGLAALLLAVGWAVPSREDAARADRLLKGSALVAAALPAPLLIAAATLGRPSVGLAWALAMGPAAAWLALLGGVRARGARSEGAK